MRRERPDAPRGLGLLAAGRLLKAIGRRIPRRRGSGGDLAGDRSIEWSFVAARVPDSHGRALDVGPGQGSDLGFIAALRGFDVTAVDLEEVERPYRHPRLTFLRGDVALLPLQPGFDLVINCSTIEHAGVAGRYGVQEEISDADLTTMQKLWHLMDPNGLMLLTIPVGRDALFPPFHRVYGPERLPRLIEGFAIEEEQFWAKHEGAWRVVDRKVALDVRPGPSFYALGCFVLKRG